eukprot:1464999-Rhodomonas_salina.2
MLVSDISWTGRAITTVGSQVCEDLVSAVTAEAHRGPEGASRMLSERAAPLPPPPQLQMDRKDGSHRAGGAAPTLTLGLQRVAWDCSGRCTAGPATLHH